MFCYTKIYRCLSISIIIVSFVLSSCTSNNNSSSVCDTNQLECASAESLSDAAVFNESDSMGVHSSESTKYETGIKNNAFEEQLFDEIVIAVDFLTWFFDFNRDNRYEIINSSFTEAQGVITAVPSEPGIYTDTNAEKKGK